MARPSIERTRSGDYRLRLSREERVLLRMLHAELATLLDDPDEPDLRRLFPPASDDPQRDDEYRGLVREQLVHGRVRALATLEETLDRDTLTAEEADAWVRVLNDLRLVLGTRLDVTEDLLLGEVDPSDPQAHDYAVYGYLSWLQEQLVAALSLDLPTEP